MKQTFITVTVSILMALLYSCSTPYSSFQTMNTFDDLNYAVPVKKTYLPRNDYQLAYTDEGKGEKTLIFIHGLGSYSQAWIRNIESLKSDYRCIAVDLPGYGKSGKEAHSGGMPFYAGIINELVEVLNLKNVYLAGHSMGGQIAITTHLLYPSLANGLVLVAPAGFEPFHKGQRQWFREVMTVDGVKLTTAEAIVNNLASNFYKMPEEADFMITDRMAMRTASDFEAYCYAVVQSVQGMVDYPVLPYLKDIRIPTLILFGENDNLIPNRYLNPGFTADIARNGANAIPGSKLVLVPECGHFMMFEKPEVFNSEARSFLQKH